MGFLHGPSLHRSRRMGLLFGWPFGLRERLPVRRTQRQLLSPDSRDIRPSMAVAGVARLRLFDENAQRHLALRPLAGFAGSACRVLARPAYRAGPSGSLRDP